jgi:lysozyme
MENKSISSDCFNLLEKWECSGNIDNYLVAYLCPAGKWTIGMGNTYYADGTRVKEGDILTHNGAIALFYSTIGQYEKAINRYVLKPINQHQFDALVTFIFNIGVDAFAKSTLLHVINRNPNDEMNVKSAWLRWIYITNPKTKKKEISNGLKSRREDELNLYLKNT